MRRRLAAVALAAACAGMAGCAGLRAQELPEQADDGALAALGPAPVPAAPGPASEAGEERRGIASWYGLAFHGRRTASGERFDMNAMTAAHPTLPFGTRVRVVNPRNGRSIEVRINDRGPHVPGRIIDLSHAAARALGLLGWGAATVVIAPLPAR